MKHARYFLTLLAASLVLANCKSSEPEFGIPDDPKPGVRGKLFDGDRPSYGELRHKWKVNERNKARQMFDRMKDEY